MFNSKRRQPSRNPRRPEGYTTPCSEFLTGRDGSVSVDCLEAWRAMFDYLTSKQDMIDIRDGLTVIIEDDDRMMAMARTAVQAARARNR